jgi:hypothetical protein
VKADLQLSQDACCRVDAVKMFREKTSAVNQAFKTPCFLVDSSAENKAFF